MIRIKKGLDLPINGQPLQEVDEAVVPKTVAVVGKDYIGIKPSMAVQVGDRVKNGQLLFIQILAIHRGARRALLSVVILLDEDREEQVEFSNLSKQKLQKLSRQEVVELLLESGLWPSLRVRPFSTVADPRTTPHSIFITAMDTNPLAPDVEKILVGNEEYFRTGLTLLSYLSEGKLFLCKGPGTAVPDVDLANLSVEEFSGPHPAGNVGTHIHFLDPVHRGKIVWYIGLQDVIGAGSLFSTGRLRKERIISLAGPGVKNPRLLKTRIGACITDLVNNEIKQGRQRLISGSVLSGRAIDEHTAYLGKYHQQVSVLQEGAPQEFLNWLRPGLNIYSIKNVMLSKFFPHRKFDFTTSAQGEKRAIIPAYNYERVMPLDLMPLFLLRSLAIDDLDEIERLGGLELDEEDLALCGFVCPSKEDFGPMLRRNLMTLQKEG